MSQPLATKIAESIFTAVGGAAVGGLISDYVFPDNIALKLLGTMLGVAVGAYLGFVLIDDHKIGVVVSSVIVLSIIGYIQFQTTDDSNPSSEKLNEPQISSVSPSPPANRPVQKQPLAGTMPPAKIPEVTEQIPDGWYDEENAFHRVARLMKNLDINQIGLSSRHYVYDHLIRVEEEPKLVHATVKLRYVESGNSWNVEDSHFKIRPYPSGWKVHSFKLRANSHWNDFPHVKELSGSAVPLLLK